jgi:hypothetical protein
MLRVGKKLTCSPISILRQPQPVIGQTQPKRAIIGILR